MKILWICLVWPEPDSSAAGARTRALLSACRNAGHEVHVSSGCQSNAYKAALDTAGFSTAIFEPNDSGFDRYISNLRPDVVVFDRFMIEEQFSWRVKTHCPHAVRVLDTVDLHCLRRARQRMALLPQNESKVCLNVPDEILRHDDSLRELASILRSDLAVVVSENERQFLVERFGVPAEYIRVVSLAYSRIDVGPEYSQRQHFVAIGNVNHPPNLDSFRLLARIVWPLIRTRLVGAGICDAELHLYGSYPSQEFERLANPSQGIRTMGKARDACETLSRYRVNLAPLRFGAGVKGKIADGWSVGTPCIATSVAAEGMQSDGRFGGEVSDSWQQFAQMAARLYGEESQWQIARRTGADLCRDQYDAIRNGELFCSALSAMGSTRDNANPSAPRWIQEMLWHQQFRATEYFSRWIEQKNTGQSK